MSLAGFLGNFFFPLFCFGRMDWVPRPGPLITREEAFIEDKSDVFSGRLASLVGMALS